LLQFQRRRAAGPHSPGPSLPEASYGRRVLAIALLGLFGWLSLIVSYWIWYGYPSAYILGEGINEVVGWVLAGLAIAKIVPPAGRDVELMQGKRFPLAERLLRVRSEPAKSLSPLGSLIISWTPLETCRLVILGEGSYVGCTRWRFPI
jgi:hypothetical protein